MVDFAIQRAKRVKKSERITLNPDCTILLQPDLSDTMSKKLCDAIDNLIMTDPDFSTDLE